MFLGEGTGIQGIYLYDLSEAVYFIWVLSNIETLIMAIPTITAIVLTNAITATINTQVQYKVGMQTHKF